MKTVTVTVSGAAGSGKSTISAIIQQALSEQGYPCEVDNPDGDSKEPQLLEGVQVQIVERQDPRSRGLMG